MFPQYPEKADIDHIGRQVAAQIHKCLEVGFLRAARSCYDRHESELRKSFDQEVAGAVEGIAEILKSKEQVEIRHGAGATLNLRHPRVQKLIGLTRSDGAPVIPERELIAARTYQIIQDQARDDLNRPN